MQLPDIQDQRDNRGIELDEVGVAGVRYPITFSDGTTKQAGVAVVDMTVTLPAERRATHMSRMIEVVHEHLQDLDPRELPTTLKAAASRLDVDGVRISAALPVAFRVTAPESGLEAWQPSDVSIAAAFSAGSINVVTTVATDVTSLCPCSKAISDHGAHNQRSLVTLSAKGSGDDVYPLPIHAAFDLVRGIGSNPVFPLIKRIDERAVTMQAHDNPAFVEDMARTLSRACRELGIAHEVRVRNYESIHSHDAVAHVRWANG